MIHAKPKPGALFREDTGEWELLVPLPRLRRAIFDLLALQPADEGLTAAEIVKFLREDDPGCFGRTTEDSVRAAIGSLRLKGIVIGHVRGGSGYHLPRQ